METYRHIGYIPTTGEVAFFSPQHIQEIAGAAQKRITTHNVTFTPEVVRALLEKNYYDYKPPQGDMFSCHQIQPYTTQPKEERVVDQTINMLIETATTQIMTTYVNNNLNIDVILYADDLRRTPTPKLKRGFPLQFNMKY